MSHHADNGDENDDDGHEDGEDGEGTQPAYPQSVRGGLDRQHIVVMGVSGSGKSTVAQLLARRLGWTFAEGDDFHPPANRAKLTAGVPLDDEDRAPWLRRLTAWMRRQHAAGECTVMAASALKRRYRDVLRGAAPGVRFVHLIGDRELLLSRMRSREHFMPADLLGSQLEDLEHLDEDETGVRYDVADPPEAIAARAIKELGLRPGA